MKQTIVALIVFFLGLVIAQYFFGVDVEKLVEGSINFLTDIFTGPS